MRKTNLLVVLALTVLLSSCASTKDEASWYEVKTENKPFTRWWWLGSAVDKENLTYNMELYSKAGMGGVEITPIYGVIGEEARDIDYLSPKWMDMYKHTVSEANRLGMIVDMNNGTGWPFGGPEVTNDEAAKRVYIQKFTIDNGNPFLDKIIATQTVKRRGGSNGVQNPIQQKEVIDANLSCLMAYSDNGEKINITDKVSSDGTLSWNAPEGKWTLYGVFIGWTKQVVKRAAPGGEGLVMDHFSREALDKYLTRFDNAFEQSGAPMPRMFFNDSYEVYSADWTPTLLDEFAKRRGYKLEEYLPEFEANGDTEISRRVISDYRQTINDLLMDNFITPWEDWAHKRGAMIRNQSHGSPGNIVDIYASVDIPECETYGRTLFDIPGIQVDSSMKSNDSNPAVLKFASSAAHITGKNLTSAETFTWLTEHFRTSLSQCKPEIDQMFASGVNHVFFHGTPYSPKDAEWPGWRFYATINMSPTNPQWNNADAFFTYITRTQSFLQSGKADNDFLLYFPIYDIWNDYRNGQYLSFSIHGLTRMIPDFNRAVLDIMDEGYDVDYISDKFISSLTVKNGELVTSGGTAYKALILPSTKFMPVETIAKIIELTKQGGKIIFSKSYPDDVPGLSNLETRRADMKPIVAELPAASFESVVSHKMGKGEILTGADIKSLINAAGVTYEPFKKDFGGQYARRSYDQGHIYFFTMLQNKSIDGWVTLGKNAESAMIFDPLTGEKGLAKTQTVDGKTQIYLQLRPCESLIIKTFKDKTVNTEPWKYLSPEEGTIDIKNGWSLKFINSEPAVDGSFEIDTLGSWTNLPIENAKINMGTGLYKVDFDLPKTNAVDWKLALGDLRESAIVRINGVEVGKLWTIPYSMNVGKYLKEGKNTIEIEVTNLATNRIADYDRREVKWRKFKNANIASMSPIKLKDYPISESGLLGKVTLTPMKATF